MPVTQYEHFKMWWVQIVSVLPQYNTPSRNQQLVMKEDRFYLPKKKTNTIIIF